MVRQTPNQYFPFKLFHCHFFVRILWSVQPLALGRDPLIDHGAVDNVVVHIELYYPCDPGIVVVVGSVGAQMGICF